MKAIKVVKPFQIEIVDVPKPTITSDNDVIIKITSGGICGSDVQIYNGTNSLATYPRVIGHEFGGIVEAVGDGVTNVKIGDKVAVDPVLSCGQCYACSQNRSNVCSTLKAMGVHVDGGFAEYVKVPQENVYKFSKDFDSSLLCTVEPYTIGMQINNRLRITGEDQVLVMGCGPIGITIMQVAKSRGAKVVMSDILPKRLQTAKELGADETILVWKEDLEERINQLTNGEGMPVVIDAVCIPATFKQSIELASPAGRVGVIGLKNIPAEISVADITKKELDLIGSRLNNKCFPSVIESFENGTLDPRTIKTAEFNFMDVQKAFDLIISDPEKVLKVTLNF
ncbi:hypothetical protein AN639_08110 [Candidatus Epulonipiscium fishelsonii]|uniref:Uncharacterized protein n=1 Tax=Candidatus Epulonipiscium fishelsonii TaxID=77094 RepID=A0ACC8X8S8_9FIRM|nr:hypothetical protein AN639_08110 [Epulopiscium sp. SCG-B05WGA-EpuloA1]ONI38538.1 hypothetical protein AN396_10440 [Epulopiscium sp. SCG-B11WGA-EpuloA1]